MKLFKNTGKKTQAVYGMNSDKEKVLLLPEKNIMEMDNETVDYLLNSSDGKALDKIRYLIANIYNNKRFPDVELFSMIRNADKEHQELVMDIIGISQSKFGQSCFVMIEELAPKIIENLDIE